MTSQHTMSPDLIAFLKAWYDWATNGAPDEAPFDRSDGLCDCVWALHGRHSLLSEELREELVIRFGGTHYPFGFDEYYLASKTATQHKNPKRLTWVRQRLVEAGEMVS